MKITSAEAISVAFSGGVGGVVRDNGESRVIPSFPVPPPGEVPVSAVPPAVIQFIPYDEHLIFQGLQLHLAEQQPFQDLILESEANIHFLQLSLCGIIGVDFWSRRFFCQLLGVPSEEKSQPYDNSFQHKTADPGPVIFHLWDRVSFSPGWPGTHYVAQGDFELLILLRLPF